MKDKKNIRKSVIAILFATMITFALSFAPASVVGANALLFEDDFESYNVGEIPSAKWWSYAYCGGSPCDHRVRLFEDNKVFSLFSERWDAKACPRLDRQLNYAMEAGVYMMPRQSLHPGTTLGAVLILRSSNRDTVHLWGGYSVNFDPDNDKVGVYTRDFPSGTGCMLYELDYELDTNTWYRVKASVTGEKYGHIKIRAFVNDMRTPVLEVTDDGSTWINAGGDQSGYTALSSWCARNYYDNVEIYEVKAVILATIDIDPDTLNLNSKGKCITCYIELPEGYDVADIDVSTMLLEETVSAEAHPTEIGDYDNDGIDDLMVKFDRSAVQEILEVGEEVEITVMGELTDGTIFEGSDTIRVVDE